MPSPFSPVLTIFCTISITLYLSRSRYYFFKLNSIGTTTKQLIVAGLKIQFLLFASYAFKTISKNNSNLYGSFVH